MWLSHNLKPFSMLGYSITEFLPFSWQFSRQQKMKTSKKRNGGKDNLQQLSQQQIRQICKSLVSELDSSQEQTSNCPDTGQKGNACPLAASASLKDLSKWPKFITVVAQEVNQTGKDEQRREKKVPHEPKVPHLFFQPQV